MIALKQISLDCECFEDLCNRNKVIINKKVELESPGGHTSLFKYDYVNLRGEKRFALEYGAQYACDAYGTVIWLFDKDFTDEEIGPFLKKNLWNK